MPDEDMVPYRIRFSARRVSRIIPYSIKPIRIVEIIRCTGIPGQRNDPHCNQLQNLRVLERSVAGAVLSVGEHTCR